MLRRVNVWRRPNVKRLFNEISTENVRYHDVDSYQGMLEVMNQIK